MINSHELVSNVDFQPDFDPDSLQWNDQLGFLQVSDESLALNSLRLLGFGTPIARQGGFDMGAVVRPLTEFSELPAEVRTIDAQGKGVGPRMYNIREALGGAKTKPDAIGVYTFDLNPERLLDGRIAQGGTVARIGRHAGRILRSKLGSVESVVADIHASYGDVDAVALEMPPLSELRQAKHGVKNPEGVTPQFVIVRNPKIILHKVGQTDAPW